MEDNTWLHLCIVIILSLCSNLATASDTITSTQPLTRNQTIVSSGEVFELGFFSPGSSNKFYIGIWHKKIPERTVVWVANRDNPLTSSSGMLKVNDNGDLILSDESGKTIWQSNQTSSSPNTMAQILDTGNFVVRRDSEPENYLWQSFDHPTDTMLPGMKLGLDKKNGINRYLTSWKSIDDPSSGDYRFKLISDGYPEFILWRKQVEAYRSGPWNGFGFSGVPEMGPSYNVNFSFVMDRDEDTHLFKFVGTTMHSRLLLNPFGVLQRSVWIQKRQVWTTLWNAPSDQCDVFSECGVFGVCNTVNSTLCQCMKGFEPKDKEAWSLRDGSDGCVRTAELNCRDDWFIAMKNMKLPQSSKAVVNESMSLADCKKSCLRNCSCTAYASMDIGSDGSGCVIWVGDLVDLRQYAVAKGGQDLYVKVSYKDSGRKNKLGRFVEGAKKIMYSWDLRIVILTSLVLQIILIFVAPFRKRVSSAFLSVPMWFAYLLADITATYALGVIAKSQNHEALGPFADPNLLAFWAPFLLVHLGGPDTITAFALEDNELWLRHSLNLIFHCFAVSYSFFQSFPNKYLWLPTLLMFAAGVSKYIERTRSLYMASTRRFRNSLLTDPDPGPNYAKLMDEYTSKIKGKLRARIEMIREPIKVKTTGIAVKKLNDIEIVQHAHNFFDTFKGLIADLIFSFRERTDSRDFFLQRNARDAFKVVEVELNFFYEILYTKVVVVQGTVGYILRFASIGLTCVSLAFFVFFNKHEIEKFDIGVTYTLLIGAIALDFIAFLMSLTSDWAAVMLTERKNFLFNFLGKILFVKRERWPAKKEGKTSFLHKIMQFVAKCVCKETVRRRWSESISQYNLINYCLNPRSKCLDKIIGAVGLTNMADSFQYVNSKNFNDDLRDFIFEELKMKAEVADDLETSMEINAARGDWILRFHRCNDLLSWVNDVDYDESLLLWHVATDLCYSYGNGGEDESNKNPQEKDYRRFAKRLSDYMLYLLMMQSTMMSTVAGIGEIRFRDTCAEAKKFFEGRSIIKKQERGSCYGCCCGLFFCVSCCHCCCFCRCCHRKSNEEKEWKKREEEEEIPSALHKRACKNLLSVETKVKPVAVKGDRSKSVLFDACMLATELNKLEKEKKWEIISKVWVELMCYSASRCRATRHAAQLSKGGQLLTVVWLLMAHFGLGNQFQISEGHARAKLIVGK